jgi:6-phosphogluconate dehydrogenase (decarboxylating)
MFRNGMCSNFEQFLYHISNTNVNDLKKIMNEFNDKLDEEMYSLTKKQSLWVMSAEGPQPPYGTSPIAEDSSTG